MFPGEVANITIESISQQIENLDAWLTRPEIYNNGAVVGSVDQFGRPLYTYPEIAGYYLSYLAYRRQFDNVADDLAVRAAQIINYQKTLWSRSTLPLTRDYSQYSTLLTDWRNEGVFIFDVAMLWRGVTDVAVMGKDCHWNTNELRSYIDSFFSGTKLDAVRWFNGRPENAPDRWSIRSGPYQLKVLAALRRSAIDRHDQRLLGRLDEVLPALVNDFNRAKFDDHNPHSIAYALEGALLLGADYGIDFSLGKRWVVRLAEAVSASDTVAMDYRRSDAIAQLLRLGCCEPFFDPIVVARLYELLSSTIQLDGSLNFTLSPCEVNYKNTWPVLFARQALGFYLRVMLGGKAIAPREFACLY